MTYSSMTYSSMTYSSMTYSSMTYSLSLLGDTQVSFLTIAEMISSFQFSFFFDSEIKYSYKCQNSVISSLLKHFLHEINIKYVKFTLHFQFSLQRLSCKFIAQFYI